MLFLINANSLLSVFICVEMQTICFYILTAYNKYSGYSSEAGLKYFIISAVFSGVFLLGVCIIYVCIGTVDFDDISIISAYSFLELNNNFNILFNVGITLTLFWFLFKLTCAPFHFWAADVYEGAPLSSTIVYSTLPKIALIYVFIRWIDAFHMPTQNMEYLILLFGLISCFIGTTFSLSQQRIKRLMIYSAIAQIGYICSVISLSSLDAYIASFIFLFIYVITSILVWNHIVLLYFFQHEFDLFEKKELKTLYITNFFELIKKNNSLAYSLVIVNFSISGIPPLLGFFSKFSIIFYLVECNEYFISFLFIIISSLSVFYYIRFLKISFFEPNNLINSTFKSNFITPNNSLIFFINFFGFFHIENQI